MSMEMTSRGTSFKSLRTEFCRAFPWSEFSLIQDSGLYNKKTPDMLIYKISSGHLNSAHDLLSFLRADPKARAAALICPISLNFVNYLEDVKCLM